MLIECKNNDEWLLERSKGIGGSDASSILGLNPYKSNVELWREKTGRTKTKDISHKPYVLYGKQAEEHLRKLFELDYPEYEVAYIPYNIHIHKDYNYLRASLDGELLHKQTLEKGIFEAKTTEIRKKTDWTNWDKKIPMNYFCQILHYFIVKTDCSFAKLKAQIKSHDLSGETILTTKHYHIERENHKNDIEMLLNKEIEFWWYVQNDKAPPLILPEI